MYNQRRFRGGSLAVFAVVGALLAIMLIGGLYYVQRYASEMERAGEVAVNEDDGDVTNDTDADNKQNNDKKAPAQSSDDAKKDSAKNDAADSSNDTPKATENDDTSTDAADDADTEDDDELPSTGPADSGLQLLALMAITYTGVRFAQSRR